MVNKAIFRIISLMSLCQPHDDELNHYVEITKAISSNEYSKLLAKKENMPIINEYFSFEKLFKLDELDLKKSKAALKILPSVLEMLVESIKYGGGPMLTSAEKPDFSDPIQLRSLSKWLMDNRNKQNLSNIKDSEYMLLFDDNTIKSAETVFMQLPSSVTDITDDVISNVFPNKKFCINMDELNEFKSQKENLIQNSKTIKDYMRKTIFSRFFIKVSLILVFLAIPLVLSMFGLLSQEYFIFMISILGVISVLYLVVG